MGVVCTGQQWQQDVEQVGQRGLHLPLELLDHSNIIN